ncbi:MAG: hypothetical protein J2P32_09510 [Actinobacteria bacterium]|nr:hypothetical protein [Actinomycetota bacterium]
MSRKRASGWTAPPGRIDVRVTQPDETRSISSYWELTILAAFAEKARLPYPLLSDQELRLAAALRLPTFRAGGRDHLKRLTLIADGEREVRHVLYPISDPVTSVERALSLLERARPQRPRTSVGV